MRPVNYEQTDKRWKNMMYSNHGDKNQTIGTSGCGPTCAAMVISTITGRDVYPTETCKWAQSHGYRTYNNGTSYSYFVPQMALHGIKCQNYTRSAAEAVKALEEGKMVISLAQKGLWTSSGHFILAYGIEGDKVLVNDPNSVQAAREKAAVSTYKQQCKYFWIIEDEWRYEPKTVKISVDGDISQMAAINLNDENYIRIRDLAPACGYTVGWDGTNKVITLTRDKEVIRVSPRELKAINYNDENYFRIRSIAPVMGYAVDWDAVNKVVLLKAIKKE